MTGAELKAIRRDILKMSDEEFALAVGLYDGASVRRIERGNHVKTSLAILVRLISEVPQAAEWIKLRSVVLSI